MTLKTRPVRLKLLARNGAVLPGAKVRMQLTVYQVDGPDVVKMVWPLTEESAHPGFYSGTAWPNTRGNATSQYLITADAGDQRMQALLYTLLDGDPATTVETSLMVNPEPWPAVYQAASEVEAARVFSEAAGASASLANGANRISLELAEQFQDLDQAVAQTAAARDVAVPAAEVASAASAEAQLARVAAEAARDAAKTNGTFTAAEGTAAGLAATTSGQNFDVLTADGQFYTRYRNNAGVALALTGGYTKAYLDGLIVRVGFRGWLYAVTDLAGKLAFGVTTAGKFMLGVGGDIAARIASNETEIAAQKTHFVRTTRGSNVWMVLDAAKTKVALAVDRAGNLISKGRDVLAELDAVKLVASALSGKIVTDSNARAARMAWVDGNGKAPIKASRTGRILVWDRDVLAEIDSLNAAAVGLSAPSTARESAAYLVFPFVDAGGKRQIRTLRKSDGVTTAVTSVGNNINPALTTDNKVLFVSDASGSWAQRFVPADGGVEGPTFATSDLAFWGDSLTAGAGGGGAANSYPTQLAALLGGRPFYNGGIGGQKSDQIAARQGAVPSLVTVDGNQIPASGGVAVTDKTVNFLVNSGIPTGTLQGTLAGVFGTMSTDASGNWTFTRALAGTAVTCPPATPFIPDQGVRLRGSTQIIIVGRNDSMARTPEAHVAFVGQMVDYLSPYYKNFALGLLLNSTAEVIGSANYDSLKARNDALKAAYPHNFFDTQSPPTDAEMAALGFVPDTTDLTDIANGCIPTHMRNFEADDKLHLNRSGYSLWAMRAYSLFQSKGW